MRFLVLAVCLVGCGRAYEFGPADPSARVELYLADCLTIRSEIPLNQPALDIDAANVRAILTREAVPDFCGTYSGWTIFVSSEERWGPVATPIGGLTDPDGEIKLARSGSLLLHELLHAFEYATGTAPAYMHDGWEERGWFLLQNEAYNLHQRFDSAPVAWPGEI